MAYFNTNPALEIPTRILCNECADAEVPFRTEHHADGTSTPWQEKPWRWAPKYGAPCHACNSDC